MMDPLHDPDCLVHSVNANGVEHVHAEASVWSAAPPTPEVPIICVLNKATEPLGIDLVHLVNALNVYVASYLAPPWGFRAQVIAVDEMVPGAWGFIIADDADQAGVLGYHETTAQGLPQGFVFARTTLRAGQIVSVTAAHELAEMLGNPFIQKIVQGPGGRAYAEELCDAVEEQTFTMKEYPDVVMSNFVMPDYFGDPGRKTGRSDYLGQLPGPFSIAHGGYMPVQIGGQWTQIFGSDAGRMAYRVECHSRFPRLVLGRENWKRSKPHTIPGV